MKEEYKTIKEFPNYEASNLGNIRRIGKEIILQPQKNNFGYLYLNFYKDKHSYRKLVHRIILSTFVENPLNKEQVNHKNGIKADNRLENLEWCTQSENQKHAILTGLSKTKGITHHKCKLSEEDVLKIFSDESKYSIIANKYNITKALISYIKRGKGWRHLTNITYDKLTNRCGINSANHKLTEEQVLRILLDNRTHKIIAKEFNISISQISSIKTGATWSNVTKIIHKRQ